MEGRGSKVWTIKLCRPARKNAVNGPTAVLLHDAFVAFDRDSEACVAVLFGEGGVFCAGADLTEMSNPLKDDMGEIGPMGISRLQLGKPVIAAIEGYCVAGGLELALWCDLRVAHADAVFGVLCRRWGVPLIDGGTVRLPRAIGQARALDMILTGREVGAAEALHMGLVTTLADNVLEAAQAMAHQVASFPQVCMRNDRRSALDQWSLGEVDALRHEFVLGTGSLRSGEGMAGAQQFKSGKGRGGSRL